MADRAAAERGGAPQQQRGTSWWTFLRSFAIQVAVFYFISSYFRGQRQPVDQDGQAVTPSVNLFRFGQNVVRTLDVWFGGSLHLVTLTRIKCARVMHCSRCFLPGPGCCVTKFKDTLS